MSSRIERLSTLHMATEIQQGIHVVSVQDRLDMYSSHELRDHCRILWDMGSGGIILDLGETSYLDSSGVGVFLSLYTHAQRRRLKIAFVNFSADVQTVLRLTRLDNFLPYYESLELALESLKSEKVEAARTSDGLVVNENSDLFDLEGMHTQVFHIDISQVRRLSNLITQNAPHEIHEINLLEQQVSELIKNAVRHGNQNDKSKSITVSWAFSDHDARLIVEDEGEGFKHLDRWNEFYRNRLRCHKQGLFEEMVDYLSFRTQESIPDDGGNAMFAAVEYWNQGVVYNSKKNKVAVRRVFY